MPAGRCTHIESTVDEKVALCGSLWWANGSAADDPRRAASPEAATCRNCLRGWRARHGEPNSETAEPSATAGRDAALERIRLLDVAGGKIIDERDELQRVFDLRWQADQRAIKRWQAAHPGNELTWPDHADLVVWLLERLDALGDAATRYAVHHGPSAAHDVFPDEGCPEADKPIGTAPCAGCRLDAALEDALKAVRP